MSEKREASDFKLQVVLVGRPQSEFETMGVSKVLVRVFLRMQLKKTDFYRTSNAVLCRVSEV